MILSLSMLPHHSFHLIRQISVFLNKILLHLRRVPAIIVKRVPLHIGAEVLIALYEQRKEAIELGEWLDICDLHNAKLHGRRDELLDDELSKRAADWCGLEDFGDVLHGREADLEGADHAERDAVLESWDVVLVAQAPGFDESREEWA